MALAMSRTCARPAGSTDRRAPFPGRGRQGVPVVEPPVVEGEDLEEVGDEAELRDRVAQRLGRDIGDPSPFRAGADDATLLGRGLEVTVLTEGAVAAALRGVEAVPRAVARPERPVGPARDGQTWVPVNGLTCLIVPSGRRLSGSRSLRALRLSSHAPSV